MKSPEVQAVTAELYERVTRGGGRSRLPAGEEPRWSRRLFQAIAVDVDGNEGFDPLQDSRVAWCVAVLREARYGERVGGELWAAVEFLLGRGVFAAGARDGKMAAAGEERGWHR